MHDGIWMSVRILLIFRIWSNKKHRRGYEQSVCYGDEIGGRPVEVRCYVFLSLSNGTTHSYLSKVGLYKQRVANPVLFVVMKIHVFLTTFFNLLSCSDYQTIITSLT